MVTLLLESSRVRDLITSYLYLLPQFLLLLPSLLSTITMVLDPKEEIRSVSGKFPI